MNTILTHIQYLIIRHDCVVVPGFGSFVARYSGATMSADGSAMLAPGREIGYNPALTHDDGLLISSVSRREGIGYDAARRIVEQDVESMHRILETTGHLEMPRIGAFDTVEGAGYSFIPAEDCVAGIAYNSLPAITVPRILTMPDDNDEEIRRPAVWRRRAASALKYAAAVAVLAVIGLTASTPMLVDRDVVKASMALPPITAPKSVDLTIAQPAVEEPVAKSLPAVIPVENITDAMADEGFGCYVVIASCASQREADRYLRRNAGKDEMRVLKRDGRYRVYVAAGDDYDAAFAYRTADPDFARRHPDAWVYQAAKQ